MLFSVLSFSVFVTAAGSQRFESKLKEVLTIERPPVPRLFADEPEPAKKAAEADTGVNTEMKKPAADAAVPAKKATADDEPVPKKKSTVDEEIVPKKKAEEVPKKAVTEEEVPTKKKTEAEAETSAKKTETDDVTVPKQKSSVDGDVPAKKETAGETDSVPKKKSTSEDEIPVKKPAAEGETLKKGDTAEKDPAKKTTEGETLKKDDTAKKEEAETPKKADTAEQPPVKKAETDAETPKKDGSEQKADTKTNSKEKGNAPDIALKPAKVPEGPLNPDIEKSHGKTRLDSIFDFFADILPVIVSRVLGLGVLATVFGVLGFLGYYWFSERKKPNPNREVTQADAPLLDTEEFY